MYIFLLICGVIASFCALVFLVYIFIKLCKYIAFKRSCYPFKRETDLNKIYDRYNRR